MSKKAEVFKWALSVFSATDDITYTAAEFVNHANQSRNRSLIVGLLITFWLCLISLLITSVVFFSNNDTLFNVSAITEKLQVSSFEDSKYPEWNLNSATIDNYEDFSEVVTGSLTIHANATITFERVAKQSLYISVEGDENTAVATLVKEGGAVKNLVESFYIEFEPTDKDPVTLPFDGTVVTGGEVKEDTAPMPVLLEGKITIADKAALSQEYYTAPPQDLNLGDVLTIETPTTQSSGFVYVNDEPGIKVTFSGKGKQATIQRFKAEPIHLENSFWTKLINDETLIFLWLFLGALYTVIKIMIRHNLDVKDHSETEESIVSDDVKK